MTSAPLATVILRLAGPMQAWSRDRRTGGGGGARPTNDHPTKTGVIGLVANALGRDRSDDITDLAGLVWAVRTDRTGTPSVDFHTAGGGTMPALSRERLRLPDGATHVAYGAAANVRADRNGLLVADPLPNPVISADHYLADAIFTGALTGPADLIRAITAALQAPARVLHLGRVAYLPTEPVYLDLHPHCTDPVSCLAVYPRHPRADLGRLTVWSDVETGGTPVHDQPGNYATRTATWRRETDVTVNPATTDPHPTDTHRATAGPGQGRLPTDFDPFTAPTVTVGATRTGKTGLPRQPVADTASARTVVLDPMAEIGDYLDFDPFAAPEGTP